MASTAESGSGDILRSERIAGGILPKVLNSFDMVTIFVAIVLFISNSAVVTGAGAAADIYRGLGFIPFLIPGAIVTGQLGLMFPGEGSIYVWTNKAFGAFLGFFAGFCAWWPGVLVMIATGVAVVSLIQQLNANFLTEPWQQGVIIIAVIAFSFVLSILRFRVTQNFVNIVFVAYGTVILALLGIVVPLNMGVEITHPRSITRYLLWGSVVVMAAYLIGTFGVMVAVPLKDQGSPSAIAEAVQLGFGAAGNFLGTLVTFIFIGFFIFNTAVYNYSFGRLLFVSGLDRRMPAFMSKVNANRVPWVAVLVQSIISAVLTAVTFIIAPYSLSTVFRPSDLSKIVYVILQAAVTVIWCISMVILFIDVIIIRYKYHENFTRSRLAPDWVFYLCSALGLIASGFAVYVVFTGSWTPLLSSQVWIVWIGSIAVISLIIGAALFFIGQATIKGDVTDEEIITKVTS